MRRLALILSLILAWDSLVWATDPPAPTVHAPRPGCRSRRWRITTGRALR